jgi:hypothetical protein
MHGPSGLYKPARVDDENDLARPWEPGVRIAKSDPTRFATRAGTAQTLPREVVRMRSNRPGVARAEEPRNVHDHPLKMSRTNATPKTNNQRLIELVDATGLGRKGALELFNATLGPGRYSYDYWRAFFCNPESTRYKLLRDDLLAHAEQIFRALPNVKRRELVVLYAANGNGTFEDRASTTIVAIRSEQELEQLRLDIESGAIDTVVLSGPHATTGWRLRVSRPVRFFAEHDDMATIAQAQHRIEQQPGVGN